MYHTTQTQNFKFGLFEILTFDDLHLTQSHKRLRGVLRSIQTRSLPFLGFISISYDCFAQRSQQGQKIKNFTLDSTCDVISDVTDKVVQYIRKVQTRSYPKPFWDRESAQ